MPLNSQHLSEWEIKELNEIPLDGEAVKYADYPYQTKTDIYDKKCNGCGFAKITAIMKLPNSDKTVIKEFSNVEDAISLCTSSNATIDRSCSYPADVTMANGKQKFPTLSEIVMNGCQFWKKKFYDDIPKDEETEFIEIDITSLTSEIISEPILHRTV